MTERDLITDEELHAFIDGELDPIRAADIAVLLQYQADLQAKVAAYRADKALLSSAYGPLIAEPVPAHWHGMIARARSPGRRELPRRAAMALAASAAVAFVGWQSYQRLRPHDDEGLIAEAFGARNETFNLDLGGVGDRVAADSALKAALGLPVKVPDMGKFGFAFARYRVYSGMPGGKAVKLDYEDSQKRVFTLYLRHSNGEEEFEMLKRDTVRVCVWQDEVLSAVMLAEVNAGEMLRLATLAYAGLSA